MTHTDGATSTKMRGHNAAYVLVISWISLLPLLYFASSGSFWFQNEGANNALAAKYGALATQVQGRQDQIISVLVVVMMCALWMRAFRNIAWIFRKDVVFGSLVGLAIVSCLWSQFPARSLHWALILAVDTAFAFYLHQRFTQEQKLQLLLMAGWACLLLSFFLVLCLPTYGIDHTFSTLIWKGMYNQKNLCATTTLFWLSVALYLPAHSITAKATRGVYICLSFLMIVMTHSMTSYVVLGCLIVYIVTTRLLQRLTVRDRLAGLVAALGILLIIAVALSSHWSQIAILFGKDPTLTGRTGIWDAAWRVLMKHPVLGYGYRAFWSGYQGESANVSLANGWAVTSAHNAFLEVWLELGALGLGAVTYSLLRSVSKSVSYLRRETSVYRGWCACIVFLTVAMSIDEGEMMIPNGLLWILFILASVGLNERDIA